MRKGDVLKFAGVVAGAAGIITLGFLLRRFITNKKVEKFEEDLVASIVEHSPIKGITKRKKKIQKSRNSKRTAIGVKKLLPVMKKGTEYTQVELQQLSHIPYRTVRRYVDTLVEQGKLEASGYGKGKRFSKR